MRRIVEGTVDDCPNNRLIVNQENFEHP